jgi:hypothetical protein
VNRDYLNSINQLVFVVVKCVFFDLRTDCLNIFLCEVWFQRVK